MNIPLYWTTERSSFLIRRARLTEQFEITALCFGEGAWQITLQQGHELVSEAWYETFEDADENIRMSWKLPPSLLDGQPIKKQLESHYEIPAEAPARFQC